MDTSDFIGPSPHPARAACSTDVPSSTSREPLSSPAPDRQLGDLYRELVSLRITRRPSSRSRCQYDMRLPEHPQLERSPVITRRRLHHTQSPVRNFRFNDALCTLMSVPCPHLSSATFPKTRCPRPAHQDRSRLPQEVTSSDKPRTVESATDQAPSRSRN